MIIDVNVYLSRWPFRRLACDTPELLVAKLRQRSVTQAWASSFDALLHKDMAAVNARVADDCDRFGDGVLLPVGSVNPMLPDWQEDLRRCQEVHGMKAIRIHPNYHGYTLADAVCHELFQACQDRGLIVQMAVTMEDVRLHHPLVRVPLVDTAPLADVVKQFPRLRLVIANNSAAVRGSTASQLAAAGSVFFEISHFESVGALETWVQAVPIERLLFGSYFPFFHLEASLLKFQESHLGGFATAAILSGNAEKLLAG